MNIPIIPDDIKTMLNIWHEKIGWSCSAHSEGLECCLDILLENVELDKEN